MASFAERLKELRTEHGLSQEELGKMIGVKKNTVYRWETVSNPPSEENSLLIAHCFRVPYAYLMGLTDDRKGVCLTDEEEAERENMKQSRMRNIC